MKKVSFVLLLFVSSIAWSQNAKYVLTMEKNIEQLDTSTTVTSLQNASNSFERIASANPGEWLPLYYQSYCNLMIGMRQEKNAKKDDYYEKAEALINKADSISPNNSEIYVIKAFITSMKISVDPQNRGMKLGPQAGMLNSQAVELDKDNPRALFLKGQGLLFTPEQFGGGAAKACPVLEEAVAKYKTFVPKSTIMPKWGEAKAIEAMNRCKNTQENGK